MSFALLPVCAGCTRVRIHGEWQAIPIPEDADLTHGICESCLEALYPPDLVARIRAKREADAAILSLPGCADDCAPCSDAAATEVSADGAERLDGRYETEEP